MVRVVVLGSGSRGNATLVEFGERRVLVDAGLSARDLERRLRAVGIEPGSIAAILLSHEHHDHARGAERFSVRHRVPVACSRSTLAAMNLSHVHLAGFVPLETGTPRVIDGVEIVPFAVPHDAADPVGFVVGGEGVRVGIATDLGQATTLVRERLRGCHILVVEANHDEHMLLDGPYPWHLKQRVGGSLGHLSNAESAEMLRDAVDDRCQAVVLAHLSEKNNTPALARAAAARALAEAGRHRIQMRVATQTRPATPVVL